MAIEATIGRPISQPRLTSLPPESWPRSPMTLDITSPTTSSMTAALTSTEPTRVWPRSIVLDADEMTANVVPGLSVVRAALQNFGAFLSLPNDVADSAAPMIKVSTGPGDLSLGASLLTEVKHTIAKSQIQQQVREPNREAHSRSSPHRAKDEVLLEKVEACGKTTCMTSIQCPA